MKPLFQGVCTALVTPFRLDFVHLEVYDQLLGPAAEGQASPPWWSAAPQENPQP